MDQELIDRGMQWLDATRAEWLLLDGVDDASEWSTAAAFAAEVAAMCFRHPELMQHWNAVQAEILVAMTPHMTAEEHAAEREASLRYAEALAVSGVEA